MPAVSTRVRMKGEERRAAIVEAAVRLFAEKGFRGTTTRELAAALGVTEPVLYQHFRTKGDLFRAIIETKSLEDQEALAGLCGAASAGDDRGFFRALALLILTRYDRDPAFVRLLLHSALDRHELAEMFYRRQVAPFYQNVAGYVRRRVRDGAFRRVKPDIAARAFIGMVSYHGLMNELFGSDLVVKASRARLVDEMVDVFLTGILAERATA